MLQYLMWGRIDCWNWKEICIFNLSLKLLLYKTLASVVFLPASWFCYFHSLLLRHQPCSQTSHEVINYTIMESALVDLQMSSIFVLIYLKSKWRRRKIDSICVVLYLSSQDVTVKSRYFKCQNNPHFIPLECVLLAVFII